MHMYTELYCHSNKYKDNGAKGDWSNVNNEARRHTRLCFRVSRYLFIFIAQKVVKGFQWNFLEGLDVAQAGIS